MICSASHASSRLHTQTDDAYIQNVKTVANVLVVTNCSLYEQLISTKFQPGWLSTTAFHEIFASLHRWRGEWEWTCRTCRISRHIPLRRKYCMLRPNFVSGLFTTNSARALWPPQVTMTIQEATFGYFIYSLLDSWHGKDTMLGVIQLKLHETVVLRA